MHIRLLLISFFLSFFRPHRNGHLFILDTPLFPRTEQEENHLLLFGGREAGRHR